MFDRKFFVKLRSLDITRLLYKHNNARNDKSKYITDMLITMLMYCFIRYVFDIVRIFDIYVSNAIFILYQFN